MWHIAAEETVNFKRSKFFAAKSDMPKDMCETNFENTARKTPQQNSYMELAFTVIAAKTRAVMNAAQIPKSERFKMWSEAARQ